MVPVFMDVRSDVREDPQGIYCICNGSSSMVYHGDLLVNIHSLGTCESDVINICYYVVAI